MCPALSTQVLFSPQPPKLFANETLYQLSYTPNNNSKFPIAKTRPNATTERSLHPCSLMGGKEAFEELAHATRAAVASIIAIVQSSTTQRGQRQSHLFI